MLKVLVKGPSFQFSFLSRFGLHSLQHLSALRSFGITQSIYTYLKHSPYLLPNLFLDDFLSPSSLSLDFLSLSRSLTTVSLACLSRNYLESNNLSFNLFVVSVKLRAQPVETAGEPPFEKLCSDSWLELEVFYRVRDFAFSIETFAVQGFKVFRVRLEKKRFEKAAVGKEEAVLATQIKESNESASGGKYIFSNPRKLEETKRIDKLHVYKSQKISS